MGLLRHSLAAIAALLAAPILLVAWLVQPKLRPGLSERFGFTRRPVERGAIWVHAASVGEVTAALPLVDQLEARFGSVVVSTTTATGRRLIRERRPDLVSSLAPLDHPWCAGLALRRVQPRALVLVETELWPCWIAAAKRHGIPVLVVSGRISDRSFPRYRRLRGLLRRTLERLRAVGARSQQDADRFIALGVAAARVSVTGDLKLDPSSAATQPPPELARFLSETPLLIAGSTHAGEEEAALAALDAATNAGLEAALLLAPRHPERFAAVDTLVRRAGRRLQRRSALPEGTLASGEVFLLDSLGELAGLYACAKLAFVGGSLVPVGGHNVLEPVYAGCPVVFGPHTQNARDAAALALAGGAGQRVRNAEELAQALLVALREPSQAAARGERGRKALDLHAGSAQRAVQLVENVLSAGEANS